MAVAGDDFLADGRGGKGFQEIEILSGKLFERVRNLATVHFQNDPLFVMGNVIRLDDFSFGVGPGTGLRDRSRNGGP